MHQRLAAHPTSQAPPVSTHVLRNVLLHLLLAQRAVGPQIVVRDAWLEVVWKILSQG